MVALEWRPAPTWLMHRTASVTVDLTSRVLAWDVAYGTSFDPGSGRWSPQTATGSLVLDNRDGRVAVGGLLVAADLRVPQLVTLSLGPGGQTLWQGVVAPAAGRRLRGDDVVRWPLHGYYWALLRAQMAWRQTDNSAAGGAPREVCRRLLRDSLGSSQATLDVTSAGSVYATGLRLRDATISGAGGSAWSLLAHTIAAIPFEDHRGRLGTAAMQQIAADADTGFPADLRALDDSEILTESVPVVWDMDLVSRNYAAQSGEVLVTTPTGGVTRGVAGRYDFPDDTIGVEWTSAQPTAAAGWTVVDWQVYPAPDAQRADVVRAVLRRDSSSAQPSGVKFTGRRLTRSGPDTIAELRTVGTAQLGQTRVQTTAPWLDPAAVGASAHAAMLRFASQPKVRARLVYPLWAPSAGSQLPAHRDGRRGMLAPAQISRYPVSGSADTLDLITGLVHLSGSAGSVPVVTVEGWAASGGVVQPWTIPTPPDPVFVSSDVAGSAPAAGLSGWVLLYEVDFTGAFGYASPLFPSDLMDSAEEEGQAALTCGIGYPGSLWLDFPGGFFIRGARWSLHRSDGKVFPRGDIDEWWPGLVAGLTMTLPGLDPVTVPALADVTTQTLRGQIDGWGSQIGYWASGGVEPPGSGPNEIDDILTTD